MVDEVRVVLRPDETPGDLVLPSTVQVIQDPATSLGMGHSLAAGARCLLAESQAQAKAVFLADMPLINRTTFEALLARPPDSIVVLSYRGCRGHPVLFGRTFWPELCELSGLSGDSGDSGAWQIIQRLPQALQVLEVNDPGVLRDIDTPLDGHALLRGA